MGVEHLSRKKHTIIEYIVGHLTYSTRYFSKVKRFSATLFDNSTFTYLHKNYCFLQNDNKLNRNAHS